MNENQNMKHWPQYLTIVTASLSMAITSTHVGWTSPFLPYLTSKESHIPVTSSDASWIVSIMSIGSIPGSVLAALMVDRLGRKVTLLIGGIPLLVGWILIIIAMHRYVIYASRFISGLGDGMITVVLPMYLGEIADKKIRGTLGSIIRIVYSAGLLYAHALGSFLNYYDFAYVCIIIPALFFATFMWMPESPYYFILKANHGAAMNSLSSLYKGKDNNHLQKRLNEINDTVVSDMSNRGNVGNIFAVKRNRYALLVMFGFEVIFQFSGILVIRSYTQEIINKSDAGFPARYIVIIMSALQLLCGFVTMSLVDRVGRRPLLLITTFLAGITLTITCVFYLLKYHFEYNLNNYGWINDASIVGYNSIISLGMAPLIFTMRGEVFATDIKGVAISIISIWELILAAIVTKMHQVVGDTSGIYVPFGCYAITCFLGTAFIYVFVPETNGKSLAEIQHELNHKIKNKSVDEVSDKDSHK